MLADILIGAGALFCVGLMVRGIVRRQKGGCGCSSCSHCAARGKCEKNPEKGTDSPREDA